jgi:hypothetical protein
MLIDAGSLVPFSEDLDPDPLSSAQIMLRSQVDPVTLGSLPYAERCSFAWLIAVDIESNALSRAFASTASNQQQ